MIGDILSNIPTWKRALLYDTRIKMILQDDILINFASKESEF
jgi:hypothetical protein